VDRHRFDADPDPNFHVDADLDPDWHQNNADSHPTPSFTHVGKSEIFLLLVTALPLNNVLSFSSVSDVPIICFAVFWTTN
jgi:hypothetical protein